MTTMNLADGVSPGEAVRIAAALIGVAVMAWAFGDPSAPPEPLSKPPQGEAR